MKLGIMQPYIFPYVGYFQLINAVDTFVIYDDVAFINRGWVNRNRLKVNGEARFFTVPLSSASQFRLICETTVAAEHYEHFRKKLFTSLANCYRKSPFYRETMPLVESVFTPQASTISNMARQSIEIVCGYLGISTRLVPTSAVYNNVELKKADRLIDMCRKEFAETYINSSGGQELYAKEDFADSGITLWFLKSHEIVYRQADGSTFIPNLSIVDVLMNNSQEQARSFLGQFDLV